MDTTIREKYLKAGRIAADARTLGASLCTDGTSFEHIAQTVEQHIINQGAGIAFPANISVNTIAAHYTPHINDTHHIRKGDLVKIDVGAHVDGYIADTAETVEVGTTNYTELIDASKEALQHAIDMIKAGVNLSHVGKKIEETIKGYGYHPIDNLTGHSLEQYNLHSGISVPNVSSRINRVKPKAGDVLAIEPFATDGLGHVTSGSGSNIYLCQKTPRARLIRDHKTKQCYHQMQKHFTSLPFAQRWCTSFLPEGSVERILKRMSMYRLLHQYPQLIEQNNGMVTQKEHTVIIKANGCDVIT